MIDIPDHPEPEPASPLADVNQSRNHLMRLHAIAEAEYAAGITHNGNHPLWGKETALGVAIKLGAAIAKTSLVRQRLIAEEKKARAKQKQEKEEKETAKKELAISEEDLAIFRHHQERLERAKSNPSPNVPTQPFPPFKKKDISITTEKTLPLEEEEEEGLRESAAPHQKSLDVGPKPALPGIVYTPPPPPYCDDG